MQKIPASNEDRYQVDIQRIVKDSTTPMVHDGKLVLVRPKGTPALNGDFTLSRQGRPFKHRDINFFVGLEQPDQFLFNYTFKGLDSYTGDVSFASNTFLSASILEDHILAVDARWARETENALDVIFENGLSLPVRTVLEPVTHFLAGKPVSKPMRLATDMIYKKSQKFVKGKLFDRRSNTRYVARRLVSDLFSPTDDYLRANNISLERAANSVLYFAARGW